MNIRSILLIGCAITALVGIIFVRKMMHRQKDKKWTIGIIQTASHPALDAARKGFIDTITHNLGNDVECIIRNGEGSVGAIHAIAQQFHADERIDALYAIATPALQAAASVEKEKPIFIAAVTDPYGLGVMHEKTNVCGTMDMIDVAAEIGSMQRLIPQAKNIGVLFSISEINAVTIANKMIEELKKCGCTPLSIGFSSQADMPQAIESSLRHVDAFIAPTDNNIASGITLLATICTNAKKPLIVSDNLLVQHGALMAQGVDYYTSGSCTGEIAVTVLRDNKKPYEIPMRPTESKKVFINKNVADALEIAIPIMPDEVVVVTNNQALQ